MEKHSNWTQEWLNSKYEWHFCVILIKSHVWLRHEQQNVNEKLLVENMGAIVVGLMWFGIHTGKCQ